MRSSSRAARHQSPRRNYARSSAPLGPRASRQRGAPSSQPPAALARTPARPAPIRHEERKTTPKQPGQPPADGPRRRHPTAAAYLLSAPPATPESAKPSARAASAPVEHPPGKPVPARADKSPSPPETAASRLVGRRPSTLIGEHEACDSGENEFAHSRTSKGRVDSLIRHVPGTP